MDEQNELVNYKNKYEQEERQNRNDNSISVSKQAIRKPNNRVKPKFFKLLGQIMNLHVEVLIFALNK